MELIRGIVKVTDKVKFFLERYQVLRSDDKKLIANIWAEEIGDTSITVEEFFKKFLVTGKVTAPESIRRARQKLQERNPELAPPKGVQEILEYAENEHRKFHRDEKRGKQTKLH
jgi:hypothetical protein